MILGMRESKKVNIIWFKFPINLGSDLEPIILEASNEVINHKKKAIEKMLGKHLF